MSLDKIFDLTAGVYFNFYNITSYGSLELSVIRHKLLRRTRVCLS